MIILMMILIILMVLLILLILIIIMLNIVILSLLLIIIIIIIRGRDLLMSNLWSKAGLQNSARKGKLVDSMNKSASSGPRKGVLLEVVAI